MQHHFGRGSKKFFLQSFYAGQLNTYRTCWYNFTTQLISHTRAAVKAQDVNLISLSFVKTQDSGHRMWLNQVLQDPCGSIQLNGTREQGRRKTVSADLLNQNDKSLSLAGQGAPGSGRTAQPIYPTSYNTNCVISSTFLLFTCFSPHQSDDRVLNKEPKHKEKRRRKEQKLGLCPRSHFHRDVLLYNT